MAEAQEGPKPAGVRTTNAPLLTHQHEADTVETDRVRDELALTQTTSDTVTSAVSDQGTIVKRTGLRQLAARAINAFKDEFGGVRKIPLEEIGNDTIAYTIWSSLRNPVAGTGPGEIPFSIIDVMANAGYAGAWHTTDYMKKYPDIYAKVRLALTNLTREGILESDGSYGDADTHGETIYYRIPRDESGSERQAKLEGLASRAQEISPRYRMN